MPVKIGTGSGAVDLSTLRAGGAEVQKIMVGTGSSAVEVWANRYVASGSSNTLVKDIRDNTWRTLTTHTVTRSGKASGTWQTNWVAGYFAATTYVRVTLNGVDVANTSRTSVAGWQSVAIPELTLVAGDVLTFQVRYSGSSTATSDQVSAWTWSLS